ncbi:MAG: ComF family protein [Peptoniphilaceae bacterium]|nr:ComF family protein [Peptoniphilaceae bacterium]
MIDFLFMDEDLCYSCKKNKDIKYKLCDDCLKKLDYVANEFKVGETTCYSIYFYNDFMKKLIGSYKFSRNTSLCKVFAPMYEDFIIKNNFLDFDYILPSPSSKKTLRARGFDHIGSIVDIISKDLGISVLKSFKKVKNTKTQHSLDRFKRSENLKDAFSLYEILEGKKILLIDDIITTGNTVAEIVKTLKDGGSSEVVGLCLASEKSII